MVLPVPIPNRLIFETRDASHANAIVNHPDVKPGLSLGLTGELNLQPLVDDPDNLLFCGEPGGALLHWCAPGVYDVHDFVLPEGRGQWARDAARQIFIDMWAKGARMLWCRTPVENRASRMFNRILGFKTEGIASRALAPGLEPQMVETFVLVAPCL